MRAFLNMRSFFGIAAILMLFVGAAANAGLAEGHFETEQSKLNTEDAGPVGAGDFEFAFAYGFSTATHQYDNGANRQGRGWCRDHTYDLGLAFGIIDGAELNLAIGYAALLDKDNDGAVHGHGWSDIEIGSKIQLYHLDEQAFTFTYAPSVVIPSGRESRDDRLGPGEAFSMFNQRLVVSKNWSRWNANLDSGYALLIGNRQGARGTWDANFAVGYQLLSWLQPEIEFHYAHDFVRFGDDADSFAMTWGVIMPLHERLRIDAGVQQTLAGKSSDQVTNVSVIATIFL